MCLYDFISTFKHFINRTDCALYLCVYIYKYIYISTFAVSGSKTVFSNWFLVGLLPSRPVLEWSVLFCRSDSVRGLNLVPQVRFVSLLLEDPALFPMSVVDPTPSVLSRVDVGW